MVATCTKVLRIEAGINLNPLASTFRVKMICGASALARNAKLKEQQDSAHTQKHIHIHIYTFTHLHREALLQDADILFNVFAS